MNALKPRAQFAHENPRSAENRWSVSFSLEKTSPFDAAHRISSSLDAALSTRAPFMSDPEWETKGSARDGEDRGKRGPGDESRGCSSAFSIRDALR